MGAVFRQLMARVATASDKPEYERILDSMPSELRAALVAWYWPKGQGITNEYLMDGYLSEEGTSVLKDLSGNGMDMELFGMTGEEGNGYVDDNGDLVFDCQDDYALSVESLTAYDKISLYAHFPRYVASSASSYSLRTISNSQLLNINYVNRVTLTGQYTSNQANFRLGTFINNNQIVVDGVTRPMTEATYTNRNSSIYRIWGSAIVTDLSLRLIILFSRPLSNTELNWTYTNMINI